jgi:hypothetical protein
VRWGPLFIAVISLPEALTFQGCECHEKKRENITRVPEVLSRNFEIEADIGQRQVREMRLGWQDKRRMPESKKDSGCKGCLPILLTGNNLVHELEKTIGIIFHFDIDLYGFESRFQEDRMYLR